ncbi:hypothetical protein BKM31_27180 [[Actinomadura] parvosata subsp. kistnae]|uniref:Uncharacterized protein n=1 Tax=[Actinomadura] parvosata subsp. kistnae TaxID=1909395 RepID=A0A1V0A378_9ACTN|nr:hypothetical protein [Nonomuraea sp. ATCC 55076]AQZ64654.1 hypothetical protein BKM31_27180 [Nonomuraea sp. ATCC 55076]
MSSDELKVPSQQQRNDVNDDVHDDRDRDALRDDPVDGEELARSEARTETLPQHDDGDYREPYARTDGDMLADEPEPEPEPVQAPGSHAAPDDVVLFDQDPTEVQARWRDLQSSFVDDPGEAVRRADGLVGEVVDSLTSTLTTRTNALRERWKETGSSADTEQLRLALRDYRTVLERLLALSSKSPAQPAQSAQAVGAGQPDPFQSQGMR